MKNARECSQFPVPGSRQFLKTPALPAAGKIAQEQGTAGLSVEFSGDTENRLRIVETLELGDAIYMKGHVLIYLGRLNGSHYVIHDGAGYAVKEGHEIIPVSGHSAFVMRLEQLVMSGQRTYLEAATRAKRFLQKS